MNTVVNGEARAQETPRGTQPALLPLVNIVETKNGYTLEAEVPGVNKDGVEITVDGNELVILGRRQKTESNAQLLYRESADADYRRVFELDPAIDAGKIAAKVEQGVLTLELPFSERVKPKKITITN